MSNMKTVEEMFAAYKHSKLRFEAAKAAWPGWSVQQYSDQLDIMHARIDAIINIINNKTCQKKNIKKAVFDQW